MTKLNILVSYTLTSASRRINLALMGWDTANYSCLMVNDVIIFEWNGPAAIADGKATFSILADALNKEV